MSNLKPGKYFLIFSLAASLTACSNGGSSGGGPKRQPLKPEAGKSISASLGALNNYIENMRSHKKLQTNSSQFHALLRNAFGTDNNNTAPINDINQMIPGVTGSINLPSGVTQQQYNNSMGQQPYNPNQ